MTQELGDASSANSSISNDVIKIFKKYRLGEDGKIKWSTVGDIDSIFANDALVVGRILLCMTHQLSKLL